MKEKSIHVKKSLIDGVLMQGMKGLCETYEIIKKSSNCISYILSMYIFTIRYFKISYKNINGQETIILTKSSISLS